MGALTLKSFPFELRGWDIEKFESIDPTDGFGSNTRVYISKNKIVQVEPDYNSETFNTWLTDKGRQFFDGIFSKLYLEKNEKHSWLYLIKKLVKILYVYDHCNQQTYKKYFFTIVFENLSLEVLTILTIISQNYSFIKLKRAENLKIKNDLESTFQLNSSINKIKLNSSTLCLLISTNPRYEGYYLNINLRQRFLKGNFKCLSIGSLINLTFPSKLLGSNLNTLKAIIEGNNLICQNIKSSKNPIVIINNELFKRNDNNSITTKALKILNHSIVFNKTWNSFNVLNPSLNETGLKSTNKFSYLIKKDLNNFSTLYFLNVNCNNIVNLKKIIESKLLNYFLISKKLNQNSLFLNQNTINNNNNFFNNLNIFQNNYHCLYSSMFYENEETFISTDGLIKKTTKLISNNKTKNNWQILRKIFKNLKNNLMPFNKNNHNTLFFNSNKISNFQNFIYFQFYATKNLTNLNYHLNLKNNSFILNNFMGNFKLTNSKLVNTKLKYWLDDFFSGGKDEYSQNSLTMTSCSMILRVNSTNFF